MTPRFAYVNVKSAYIGPNETAMFRILWGCVVTDDLMTIREMCDRYDVTPRTLRFYESKELLSPIREGQKRLFTRRERVRLKLILRGKRFGFNLEEIRQLLDMYNREDPELIQLRRTYEVARERLADMELRRQELSEAIDDLKDQMTWAEGEIASLEKPAKSA